MIVTIHHYEFEITEPYAEGQPLTAKDAAILNHFRVSAIRETFTRRIPKREIFGPEVLKNVRARLAEYDKQFHLAAPPTRSGGWTLDEELRLLRAENYNAPDIEEVSRRRYVARLNGTPGPITDYIWNGQ